MKKIISLLLLSLAFVSCSKSTNNEPQETKWVKTVEYNGHTYIKFYDCLGTHNMVNVLHDPDCKCQNDK